jgi:hypothetical protein
MITFLLLLLIQSLVLLVSIHTFGGCLAQNTPEVNVFMLFTVSSSSNFKFSFKGTPSQEMHKTFYGVE